MELHQHLARTGLRCGPLTLLQYVLRRTKCLKPARFHRFTLMDPAN